MDKGLIEKGHLGEILSHLNSLPDDDRRQLKLDMMVEIIQGETSNSAAGIFISLLSNFCVTVSTQQGFDPMMIIANIAKETREQIRSALKEAGIGFGKPPVN